MALWSKNTRNPGTCAYITNCWPRKTCAPSYNSYGVVVYIYVALIHFWAFSIVSNKTSQKNNMVAEERHSNWATRQSNHDNKQSGKQRIKALELASSDLQLKSGSEHHLDFFQPIPGSTPCMLVAYSVAIINWFASCQSGFWIHWVSFTLKSPLGKCSTTVGTAIHTMNAQLTSGMSSPKTAVTMETIRAVKRFLFRCPWHI